jgi:hypothetical protein
MRLTVPLVSTVFLLAACNSDSVADSGSETQAGTETATTDTDTGETGDPELLDTFGSSSPIRTRPHGSS